MVILLILLVLGLWKASMNDAAEVADFMPDDLNVWSDGSCVTDDLAIISVAGAGVFSVESGMAWHSWNWGHLDDVPLENGLGGEGCLLFCGVPGPCSIFRELNFGELSWPFRLERLFLWEWIIKMLSITWEASSLVL